MPAESHLLQRRTFTECVLADAGNARRKSDLRQFAAIGKRIVRDLRDPLRKSDFFQGTAALESVSFDAFHAVRKNDALQRPAIIKGMIAYRRHVPPDCDARQIESVRKRILPDACDRFAAEHIFDHDFSGRRADPDDFIGAVAVDQLIAQTGFLIPGKALRIRPGGIPIETVKIDRFYADLIAARRQALQRIGVGSDPLIQFRAVDLQYVAVSLFACIPGKLQRILIDAQTRRARDRRTAGSERQKTTHQRRKNENNFYFFHCIPHDCEVRFSCIIRFFSL